VARLKLFQMNTDLLRSASALFSSHALVPRHFKQTTARIRPHSSSTRSQGNHSLLGLSAPKPLFYISLGKPKYHYHIFHDLGSLYWLLVWIVLSSEPVSCDLSPDNDIYELWAQAFSQLFSPEDFATGWATKLKLLSQDLNYFVWSAIILGVG
jgi:hypothetical protein